MFESLSSIWPFIECVRDVLGKIIESNGFAAVAGGFAGAWGGAYGAQKIAERKRSQEELLKEFRSTNAAIQVVVAIFESVSALKRQHIKPLYDAYKANKEEFLNHLERSRQSGSDPRRGYVLEADFVVLNLTSLPLDVLRDLFFQRLTVKGHALRQFMTLSEVADSLRLYLNERNLLIQSFTKNSDGTFGPHVYFGIRTEDGFSHQQYSSAMDAISRYTDDVIYFSHRLCLRLEVHGKNLGQRLKDEYRMHDVEIAKVDFAAAADVIPSDENAQGWDRFFAEKPAAAPSQQSHGLISLVKKWLTKLGAGG